MALRRQHPSCAAAALGLPVEVLAALRDCEHAAVGLLQSLAEVAGACARGDAEAASVALSHVGTTVHLAEAVFLRACKRHNVAPEAVVGALASVRVVLQGLADSAGAPEH
ncbi:hypothetical protein DB31_5975 [Hyalangium minutum]|uniref:Uncharacterized protein n=1 Tax=Hyalangium minutum TaxID=394096 RepID=A0A085VXE1_9BACT|nr:hypothetical protein DB31_5975 [Hyalangium minutum]